MATRLGLLEDAIDEGGAPTVANLLVAAGLPDDALHRNLAREAIIMVYLDVDHEEGSDMDALFVAAEVANTNANLALVMRLITAMPPADEGSESEGYWSEEELFSDDEDYDADDDTGVSAAAA